MENQNVSATYVPLMPPYQIIKYGHDIGMQIGTLIVTQHVAKGYKQPFRIETHSYPVVSYENKDVASQDKSLFHHCFMEGVVWNRVELKKVSTLCLSNSHLPWSEFVNLLWDDNDRCTNTHKIQRFMFDTLPKFGVSIDRPQPGEYTIHLYTDAPIDMPATVKSRRGDCFALNVVWCEDVDELARRIIGDLMNYLLIISPRRKAKGWKLTYETNEEKLKPLVEKLNTNSNATRFGHTMMASFFIVAIDPYEEEKEEDEDRAGDPQNLKVVRKLGRPKAKEFEEYIIKDTPGLMSVLEHMMAGKKGKDAFRIILAITGDLIEEPSIESVCNKFPSINRTAYEAARSRHYGINRYFGKAKPIKESELKQIRDIITIHLNNYSQSQILPSQNANEEITELD